ncbi:MAG: heavy metal translocating P-type ATPase, partial [Bryobacteraceae bacterium]
RRNPALALLFERNLSQVEGVLRASASPLTGRILVISETALSTAAVHEITEMALAVAMQELLRRKAEFRSKVEAEQLVRLAGKSSSTEDEEQRRIEAKVNRDLVIALISLGCATAGLVWPAFAALSIAGFAFVTFPIYRNAVKALRRGKVNLDTLVTVTAIGGLIKGHFWILNYASVIYPISRKLVLAIQDRSRRQLIDVFREQPSVVYILVDSAEVECPFAQLKAGDVLVLRPGDMVPADGILIEGSASVDQRVLTGEAQPVDKCAGDQILAATRILSGRILVEVKAIGADTVLGRIGEILNRTANFKSATQLRAETLAEKTVVPTLATAGVAIPFVGLQGALGVVNAHFRHKVTTLAPLATLNYLTIASREGILIKDGHTLDRLKDVDTIVFDKTGTLTEEQPEIGRIFTCDGCDENEILAYAAAAERTQAHPFARTILGEAKRRRIPVPSADLAPEYNVGLGLTATLNGAVVRVGSLRFMDEFAGVAVSPEVRRTWETSTGAGNSVGLVAIGNKLVGGIELLPSLRTEAAQLIAMLRARPRIRSIHIISGDHEAPTRRVAEHLGVDSYFSQTLPENKADIIDELQSQGRRICYIGDGINDSIALKKSHVSISLSGASTAATDTAQIVLLDGTLNRLDYLFDLGGQFVATMDATVGIIIAPTIIGIACAFLWNFGLVQTVILSEIAFGGGLLSAMAPRFAYHHGREQREWERLRSGSPLSDNA